MRELLRTKMLTTCMFYWDSQKPFYYLFIHNFLQHESVCKLITRLCVGGTFYYFYKNVEGRFSSSLQKFLWLTLSETDVEQCWSKQKETNKYLSWKVFILWTGIVHVGFDREDCKCKKWGWSLISTINYNFHTT